MKLSRRGFDQLITEEDKLGENFQDSDGTQPIISCLFVDDRFLDGMVVVREMGVEMVDDIVVKIVEEIVLRSDSDMIVETVSTLVSDMVVKIFAEIITDRIWRYRQS